MKTQPEGNQWFKMHCCIYRIFAIFVSYWSHTQWALCEASGSWKHRELIVLLETILAFNTHNSSFEWSGFGPVSCVSLVLFLHSRGLQSDCVSKQKHNFMIQSRNQLQANFNYLSDKYVHPFLVPGIKAYPDLPFSSLLMNMNMMLPKQTLIIKSICRSHIFLSIEFSSGHKKEDYQYELE